MSLSCCLGRRNNYRLELLRSNERDSLDDGDEEIVPWRSPSSRKSFSIYKITVLGFLIVQLSILCVFAYFALDIRNEVIPLIPQIRMIVNKTKQSLPSIQSILDKTEQFMPKITMIIDKTQEELPNLEIFFDRSPEISHIIQKIDLKLPEIMNIINLLNETLPHIESILDRIDSPTNLNQINDLIKKIPELINVINFINASIPEIEYILHWFHPGPESSFNSTFCSIRIPPMEIRPRRSPSEILS